MQRSSSRLTQYTVWRAAAAGLVLAAGLLLTGVGARAQSIDLQARERSLSEVTQELKHQTGYEFHLALSKELEEARRPVPAIRRPLSTALSELGSLFQCDFFSLDAGGFYVVAAPKPEEVETGAGPYRLRVGRVTATDQPGTVQLTLQFAAPDETTMEAIAGVRSVQAQDNFGRSLVPASDTLRTTTGTRVRLTEFWQRLPLFLRDDRALRIRAVRGDLVLFRRVTPLHFEFPVENRGAPVAREQNGLTFRLEKALEADGRWSLDTRLSWKAEKAERAVAGQGLSRTPQPYLVDAGGRIYRDIAARLARFRTSSGEQVLEQHLRFDGLDAKPVRLVYDVFLKEEPGLTIPFHLGALPLPGASSAGAHPELRPFFDAANGGTVTLSVTDRNGKPAEGEVSLGISRKERDDDSGWTGVRWLDEVTDPDGHLRLEHFRPGTYRVIRVFRLDPSLPPVSTGRTPVEITVQRGMASPLPELRLGVAGR